VALVTILKPAVPLRRRRAPRWWWGATDACGHGRRRLRRGEIPFGPSALETRKCEIGSYDFNADEDENG
jgi:hypothetical protein